MTYRKIRIGTRGSRLALVQTQLVIDKIKEACPELECEIVVIKTQGDKLMDKPLYEFGGKGAFVTEFEEKIINSEIDIAIHSAKDMPMNLAEGLEITAVLKREDPRDVLITMDMTAFQRKTPAIIGTSSLRRQVQVQELFHNAMCKPLRGNVDTRLQKLEDGMYDGIILAAAGIKRLGLDNESKYQYHYLEIDDLIPAGGQGIIAIEGKSDTFQELFYNMNDSNAKIELELERTALQRMNASCHEAVGIYTEVHGEEVIIRIMKEYKGMIRKRKCSGPLTRSETLIYEMIKNISEDSFGG